MKTDEVGLLPCGTCAMGAALTVGVSLVFGIELNWTYFSVFGLGAVGIFAYEFHRLKGGMENEFR